MKRDFGSGKNESADSGRSDNQFSSNEGEGLGE